MSPAKAASAEEVEEEYVPGERSQMWIHEAHVQYLKSEYGDDVFKGKKVHQVIAIAFATRRDYRDSEVYDEAKEAHEEEKELAKEEKAAAAAERKAEREAAAAEKAEAKKGSGTAKKTTTRKRGAAAKKATGSTTRKRTRSKPAATEDDPFDE